MTVNSFLEELGVEEENYLDEGNHHKVYKTNDAVLKTPKPGNNITYREAREIKERFEELEIPTPPTTVRNYSGEDFIVIQPHAPEKVDASHIPEMVEIMDKAAGQGYALDTRIENFGVFNGEVYFLDNTDNVSISSNRQVESQYDKLIGKLLGNTPLNNLEAMKEVKKHSEVLPDNYSYDSMKF
ncbi:MAG: hypothetical protein ABEJ95_01695 [Candidatus Nanohalobium sp.]